CYNKNTLKIYKKITEVLEMGFHEIKIQDFDLNPFTSTGKDWSLVTAGDENGINTMTVTWGMMGYLWRGPVISVYIRPTRYTKKFVDEQNCFSLSFFNGYKKELHVLGLKSGRDVDKIAEVGFNPIFLDGVPAFEEAKLVIVAEKLYIDDIKPENFIDKSIPEKLYTKEEPHIVYTGRVKKIYVKD
ncbi:MAG: flavin reductase, partial [Leptotrichia hongkongensis]